MSTDAARVGDMHSCPKVSKLLVPHTGGPAVATFPVQVFAGGLPALRVGDLAVCAGATDVILEGAADVLVEGLPWAGRSHKTAHGGAVTGGLASVKLGGPTFTLPSTVRIDGPTDFKNRVIRDLFELWKSPSRALFDRLEALGLPMTFVPDEGCPAWPSTKVLRGRNDGEGITLGYNIQTECTPLPPHAALAQELVDMLLSIDLPGGIPAEK